MQIAEVSEKYKLSQDTLRYYERIGLIPRVNRSRSGIRDYTEEDLRWVEFTSCMRGAGLCIEFIIEYVALFQQGETTKPARKALLVEQREILAARIKDMQDTLAKLDAKIARYDVGLAVKEQALRKPEI
jgi:DNA-binding transcriptional MerR regulator